ncbi:MAG: RNB domain-containing ribonuclease [Treponema sp.]|nr:RNB domain-containing ribonuclease [Treponema sp.]MCL2250768.1 RNB domain-containing ribonuclease [Treponema sp.]
MITENALVIYKNKPAIVKEKTDGKILISLQNNEQLKVRDKDIELIHPGPVNNFKQLEESLNTAQTESTAIKEAWELMSDENSVCTPLSIKEFTSLIFNDYTPASAFCAYSLLQNGLFFTGTITAIKPRPRNEVEAEEAKRNEKLRETSERTEFLELIKSLLKKPSEKLFFYDDERRKKYAHYMQDAEALAYGKSIKSRTLKDLKLSETPEDAHSLLLKTGFWTANINPYPSRFGLSPNSASICPAAPPNEERIDLCRLAAFAIDSPWSKDPDDAVSIEITEDGKTFLYVHVADPASSISFDSPQEREARNRGVTLYLPEGAARMLAEESLPLFALGLSEKSLALTFKMTIDENAEVIDTQIFPSVVKVNCISYEDADKEIANSQTPFADTLRALYNLSQRIFKRRIKQGAVNIELPDIHIEVKNGIVNVEPIITYKSDSLVKECMIAAGEGAGTWAASRGLAVPYISQEIELQEFAANTDNLEINIVNSLQLRRCMRPRILSVKPGFHQGLGLDIYLQVTSPLRRYTDLLAHMQIRAFLRGEKTLNAEEVSARIGFCEAAVAAAVQTERASINHWLMVYLSDKKESLWDAVVTENKINRMQAIIPSLALEIHISMQRNLSPNDKIQVMLKSVNISRREAVFVQTQK